MLNLFTVPAGRTAIVRTASFCNTSQTLTAKLRVLVDPVGPNVAGFLVLDELVEPTRTFWLPHDVVLNPGDTFQVKMEAGGPPNTTVYCYGFGSLLEGEPV